VLRVCVGLQFQNSIFKMRVLKMRFLKLQAI
jgi:hypothetical protein